MSQASNKVSSKAFKLSRAHGLAMSGLVFYLVHILQQAQARDAAVLAETMTVQDDGVHQEGDTSDAVTVASVETLEPVFIESTPSQSIETTVVVDEEETSEEVMNGKDAVDVSDGGVSPLLLLGGVALIGGGIAVLTNDDGNDSDEEVTVPTLTVPDVVVSESDAVARVLFELSQPSATDTEVTFHILSGEDVYEGYDYSIESNSGGDDVVGANRVIIPAGESQAEFEIPIIDDYLGEMNEDLKILVETPLNYSFKIEEQISTVTIEDNDLLYDMSSILSYVNGDTFKSINWPLGDMKAQFVTLSESTGDNGGLAHVALDSDGVVVRTVIDTDVTSDFNNLAVVDFDSDGVDEVVVAQKVEVEDDTHITYLHVYQYESDGFSSQVVEYPSLDSVNAIEGFDVNYDGSQDIVLGNYYNTKMLALLNPGHEDSETLDISQWDKLWIDDGSDSSMTYGYFNRINISHADSNGDGIKELLTSFAWGGESGEGASFSYTYNSDVNLFEVEKITDTGGRGAVAVDENELIPGVDLVYDNSGTVSYINDIGDDVGAWDSGRAWVYEVGIEDLQHDGHAEVVVATWNNFAISSGEMRNFITLEDLVTEETYISLSSGIFAYEIIEEDATDSSIAISGTSRDNFGLWLLSATDRETAGKTYEQTTLDISDLSTFPTLSFSDVVVSEASKTADITLTLDSPVGVAVAVDYTTSSDTALAGVDFMATQGQVIFEPGETTQTVSVPLIDSLTEESKEIFKLFLHSAQGVHLDRSYGEITIEDNDYPQSAFIEDFSTGLDNWDVSPDSATGYQFEYITDFSDIANLDTGWINAYMSEPELTTVNDGYVVFAARAHQEVLYASIETANPISVDPLTDAYLSLESLYLAYEHEPYSAAVIAAVKTSEVEWHDFSETIHLDLIKAASGEGVMFDSNSNGNNDTVAYQLHSTLTEFSQSENPTLDSLKIPNEIFQNSGEVDIALIFVGTNLFGVLADDIELTSGITGEPEVDPFG